MWYIKFSWTLFIFFILVTLVKGSCLEYGHSCWGAHGKRSGGKVQRASSNLPSNEMEYFAEPAGQQQSLYDNLDYIVNTAEDSIAATRAPDMEEESHQNAESTDRKTFKKLFHKRVLRLNHMPNAQTKRSNINVMNDPADSWHQLPLFKNMQKQFATRNDDTVNLYYELK